MKSVEKKKTIKDHIVEILQTGYYCYGQLAKEMDKRNIFTQSSARECARLKQDCTTNGILLYKGKEYKWDECIKGKNGVKYFNIQLIDNINIVAPNGQIGML